MVSSAVLSHYFGGDRRSGCEHDQKIDVECHVHTFQSAMCLVPVCWLSCSCLAQSYYDSPQNTTAP